MDTTAEQPLICEILDTSNEFSLHDPKIVDRDTDLVLTGRKRVGKTYFATILPHEELGFSDPMVRVCEGVLGTSSKDVPGVRDFLVNIGAVGRGETPPREMRNTIDWAGLTRRLRRDGASITGMGTPDIWTKFGERAEFWIDVMEERVDAQEGPVVIHNARFSEEVVPFVERGFQHLHVMASEETRRARLEAAGEEPRPEAFTEQLARELDRVARGANPLSQTLASRLSPTTIDDVQRLVSVVWSDERNAPQLISETSQNGDIGPRSDEEEFEVWEPMFPHEDDERFESGIDPATEEEPTPRGKGDDVASLVHEDLESRVEEGEDEYGERLTTENGRDPLVDAYQEVLDTALYLRQELAERA